MLGNVITSMEARLNLLISEETVQTICAKEVFRVGEENTDSTMLEQGDVPEETSEKVCGAIFTPATEHGSFHLEVLPSPVIWIARRFNVKEHVIVGRMEGKLVSPDAGSTKGMRLRASLVSGSDYPLALTNWSNADWAQTRLVEPGRRRNIDCYRQQAINAFERTILLNTHFQ